MTRGGQRLPTFGRRLPQQLHKNIGKQSLHRIFTMEDKGSIAHDLHVVIDGSTAILKIGPLVEVLIMR